MSDHIRVIITIAIIILFVLLLSVFIITMVYKGQLKHLSNLKRLDEIKTNHEKVLLQTQVDLQEQTLQEISDEIHDSISLSLSLCKLQLKSINFRKRGDFPQKINDSIKLLNSTISRLNHISKSLDAEQISRQGLVASVKNEIGYLRRTGLYEINFRVTGMPVAIGGKSECVMFRIFQEALNNIIKHSKATAIDIQLTYTLQQLEFRIMDNGIGFNRNEESSNSGSGFWNMKKRAQLLEAHLEITGTPQSGTVVTIFLPTKPKNCNGNRKAESEDCSRR
jgi:two-component system, NarL family, sensor kinase